jgi:hypothetical protein
VAIEAKPIGCGWKPCPEVHFRGNQASLADQQSVGPMAPDQGVKTSLTEENVAPGFGPPEMT